METAFGWLGQIIEALLQFFPRLVIVRNTQQAVKWKIGGKVIATARGCRTLYWPLTTDIEVIVVARQPINLSPQSLMTRDMETVSVGAVAVYRIVDVVQAIGEKNWDVEQTVGDITQAAVVEEIMKRDLATCLEDIAGGNDGKFCRELTTNCRKQLSRYGVTVDRASLTDFTTATAYNVIGQTTTLPVAMEE